MAANRTAYLLSHAAAQADRSHRPECDDGSPRTDLPPHFGAPPPRSWALPSPPRCDAGASSRRSVSGQAACACLARRRVRGIWIFGDSLLRDIGQRLAQILNEGTELDLRRRPDLLWKLRCGVLDTSNFTSDIKYAPALGELYAPEVDRLRAGVSPADRGLLQLPSMRVCGGRVTLAHVRLADLAAPSELSSIPRMLARRVGGPAVPPDVVLVGAGVHTTLHDGLSRVTPANRRIWQGLFNRTAGAFASALAPQRRRATFVGYSARNLAKAPEWVQRAGQGSDLLADLNELGRSAFGGQYVDVFCATARRADDDAASMDGLHYDDEANWLKAQVVLGRICDGS